MVGVCRYIIAVDRVFFGHISAVKSIAQGNPFVVHIMKDVFAFPVQKQGDKPLLNGLFLHHGGVVAFAQEWRETVPPILIRRGDDFARHPMNGAVKIGNRQSKTIIAHKDSFFIYRCIAFSEENVRKNFRFRCWMTILYWEGTVKEMVSWMEEWMPSQKKRGNYAG